MVRVIAGEARGRKLKTIDSEQTKPTLDRVKEAMFSMIMPYIRGAEVLDVFSGNGSLGIEALSRGALSCVFNDFSADCCKIIKENLKTLGFEERSELVCNSYDASINTFGKKKKQFDILLLDPPYGKGLIEETLKTAERAKICKSGAGFPPRSTIAVCEHARTDELPERIGSFEKLKTNYYGTVGVTVYSFNKTI